MIKISQELSNRIKLLNIISVLMIVGIHCRPPVPPIFNTAIGFTQELLCNGLFRVAVPLLFLISGLLFFKNIEEIFDCYHSKLKSRIRTLVIPYLLYSIFVLVLNWILKTTIGAHPALNNSALNDITPNSISNFLFLWLFDPFVHLWFLRDLIILVLISPIIFYFVNKAAFLSLLFVFTSWLLEIQIFPKFGHFHLINIESLAFFCLGAYLTRGKFNIENLIVHSNVASLMVIAWISGNIMRIIIDPGMSFGASEVFFSSFPGLLTYKISIIVGIKSVLYISQFVNFCGLIRLSEISFSIYLFHAPLHNYIGKILELTKLDINLFFILKYMLTITITVVIALWIRTKAPPLYHLITGGRDTQNHKKLNLSEIPQKC